MKKKNITIVIGIILSILPVVFGYFALGVLVAAVFAAGYIGGLICWLLVKREIPFRAIRLPYWLTWIAFILLHKPEERYMKFFEEVSAITGKPVPSAFDPSVVLLLIAGVLPWLFVPVLIKRNSKLGYCLAWTFFASMGLTELAHFLVFPFLKQSSYAYFPGMASAAILIPLAFWGMYRLAFYRDKKL